MRISIVAVGTKMPSWVQSGFDEYKKRFTKPIEVDVKEVSAIHRNGNTSVQNVLAKEADRISDKISSGDRMVLMDRTGKMESTEQFAARLQRWLDGGQNISIVIGGPEGVDQSIVNRADERVSFSPMTFPHPLVRIMLIEQLYRAWSFLNNHPYHK